MKLVEVRAVRRRLALYPDLLALAKEKDREVLELQLTYEELAEPKAIRYDRDPGGRSEDKESIYLNLFADQKDAEDSAKAYREEAARLAAFIERVDDDVAKAFMKEAYVDGERYWQIGDRYCLSASGVQMRIERGLEKTEAKVAKAHGLL